MCQFLSHWYDSTRKNPVASGIRTPDLPLTRRTPLTTRPTRRCSAEKRGIHVLCHSDDNASSFILQLQWYCYGRDLGDTAEGRGGAHMGIIKRYDSALSGNWKLSLRVKKSLSVSIMHITYLNMYVHKHTHAHTLITHTVTHTHTHARTHAHTHAQHTHTRTNECVCEERVCVCAWY